MDLGVFLIVLLIILLIGALPRWSYSSAWGLPVWRPGSRARSADHSHSARTALAPRQHRSAVAIPDTELRETIFDRIALSPKVS
jgi:hypothetical protein